MSALAQVVRDQTCVFRKGEVVRERTTEGGLRVVTIDAFPETPLRGTIIDMHFFNVGFTEAAADREGFLSAFRAALGPGEFSTLTAQDWEGGPSYITVGGWIGDQTLALALMALVAFHEVGEVITPALLGVEGEAADQMAGMGMVLCQVQRGVLTEGVTA